MKAQSIARVPNGARAVSFASALDPEGFERRSDFRSSRKQREIAIRDQRRAKRDGRFGTVQFV